MKDWLEGLQTRERLTLIWGGVALLLILVYFLAWRPLVSTVDALEASAQRQTETLLWMQQASAQIRAQGGAAQAPTPGGSLLTVVDRSAGAAGLKGALERMEPDGADRVRLWVAPSSFDALVRWLGTVQTRHGLRVEAASFEPGESPGTVQARITLSREPT
jgi:general secretion pathway protein M